MDRTLWKGPPTSPSAERARRKAPPVSGFRSSKKHIAEKKVLDNQCMVRCEIFIVALGLVALSAASQTKHPSSVLRVTSPGQMTTPKIHVERQPSGCQLMPLYTVQSPWDKYMSRIKAPIPQQSAKMRLLPYTNASQYRQGMQLITHP